MTADRVSLIICAVACGLMAGLFFTFSCFVMQALSTLEPKCSIAAMQAINRVIINRLFFLLFFGAAAVTGFVLVRAVFFRAQPDAHPLCVTAALMYLLGALALTAILHVPLNKQLAKFDAETAPPAAAAVAWRNYYNAWVPWNHVRTVSATVATLLFVLALTR